jgi:hypothetical protein
MAGIFISYRRGESRHAAGRLADDLAQAFGPQAIFRDIEGIDPGVDFSLALEKALATCNVMLVLIGPQWLGMQDAQGRRRLDLPTDWIRQEIATALQRDIRVIPVMLEGAALPEPDELPSDLQALVRRQALDLADGRWKGDLQRLVETLARVPGLRLVAPGPAPAPAPAPAPSPVPTPPPAPASKKGLWTGIVLGAGGLLALAGMVGSDEPGPDPAPFPAPSPSPTPPPSPAPSPSPSPAPAPSPAANVPQLAGLWRTLNGESYDFQQSGADLRFTAHMNGMQVGTGRGRYADGMLRLTMTAQTPNGAFTVNCDMQATLGPEHWAGMCLGPNGAFAAQMFR